MKLFFSVILLFLIYTQTIGQNKWTKKIDKIESFGEKGDYSKARSRITKLQKKVERKKGVENIYSPYLLLKKAKYDLAVGKLFDFEKDFYEALARSDRNHSLESRHGSMLKIEAAEIASSIGRYQEASLLLASAGNELGTAMAEVPTLETQYIIAKGEILGGQGYFTESIKYLTKRNYYFASHLSRKQIKTDSLDSSTIKISKKEGKELSIEYANYLTTLLTVYGNQGRQLAADSIYVRTLPWINKKLGKKSYASVKLRYRMAVILMDHGTPLRNELSPKKMYHDFVKKHLVTQPLGFEIEELYLKELINEGKLVEYFDKRDSYKRKMLGKISSYSIYWIRLAVLECDPRFKNLFAMGKYDGKLVDKPDPIQVLNNFKSLPKNGVSVRLLEFLQSESVREKKYSAANEYANELVALKSELTGSSSPETHLAKLNLANHLVDFSNDLSLAKSIYDSSYRLVSPEIGFWHKDHLTILNHIATLNEMLDNYSQASATLEKALEVAYSKYGIEDLKYAQELTLVSSVQIKLGDYENADRNISSAIQKLDRFRREDEKKIYLVNALEVQAELFCIRGDFAEATTSLSYSRKIIRRSDKWTKIDDLSTATGLANLYLLLGKYSQARKLLPTLIEEYKTIYGATSIHLIEPLISAGKLNLVSGEYSEAEKIGLAAYEIAFNTYGSASMKTALVNAFLGEVYFALGDYTAAEKCTSLSLTTQQDQFGNNHIEVAKSLSELALIKFYNGDNKKEVEKLLLDSRDIIENVLGKNSPQYAETLKRIAILYMSEKRYDIAFSSLTKAEAIWVTRDTLHTNINLADIYTLTSDVYYIRRQFDRAEDFLKKSQQLYQQSFGRNNPEYVKVMAKLSRVYYMKGEYKKAKKTIEDVLDSYSEFITKYFPSLSENQKSKYWNTIKDDFNFYYSLAFGSLDDFRNLTSKVYDFQLMTKAMLLNSSIKVRQRILASNDDDLKSIFRTWLEKKEILTSSLAMSLQQQIENEIDVGALALEIELLEKELSEKSEAFSTSFDTKKISYKDVQSTLGKHEVALEIVRYNHFDHVFTDSVIYVGLYVKNDNKAPATILFPDGKNLEKRYFKYYRNSMMFKSQDDFSYSKFWEPIASAVGQTSTIYFSPDGVFNQINLESIPTPNGKYVIDEANIVLITNSKTLYLRKAKARPPNLSNTALMFGNPSFYLASANGKIPSLPGTEKEVEDLEKLLTTNGWKTIQFTNQFASEEKVKEMESPKIFHVATHGFYNSASNETTELNDLVVKPSTNPLLKTGLLLQGAGDLLDETNHNYNLKDGILTAYEAMNLNLDNTELVVLSACESGLGEISNGEGVYGLQRAFLVAGAKMLIMSLFKVDDDATQKLIQSFYTKWLTNGNLRQSFIDSKKELRIEYPEPIYWGSFIIIGLE